MEREPRSPRIGRWTSLCPATELEAIVAGVLSTFPPHDKEHPQDRLPAARAVLDAISDWESRDAREVR